MLRRMSGWEMRSCMMTLCWLLMATWMGALPSASWQRTRKKVDYRLSTTRGVEGKRSCWTAEKDTDFQTADHLAWSITNAASDSQGRTPALTQLVSGLHRAPSSGDQRTLHLLQPLKIKHPIMMVYLPRALLQLGCTQFNCTWCNK